jgi:hypothetical protein
MFLMLGVYFLWENPKESLGRTEGREMEVGDTTAVSVTRERISPSRSAKNYFIAVF